MENNERLDIEYDKKLEKLHEYGIVKFVLKAKIPSVLFNHTISYFYYLNDPHDLNIEQKQLRNLNIKDVSSTIIDGLLLFKNYHEHSELGDLKHKVIRSLLDTECLLNEDIRNECVRLTEQLKAIYDSLCSSDAQYLDLFKKVIRIFNSLIFF
jgi:hypothetical protein